MSLRRQLDTPTSPVRRLFDEHLPRLAPAMRANWKPGLAGREPRRAPDGAPAGVLGHANSERLVWTRAPLATPTSPLLGADELLLTGATPALIEELHKVAGTITVENTHRAAGAATLIGLMDQVWRYSMALEDPIYDVVFTAPGLDEAIERLPQSWLADVMAITAQSGPLLTELAGSALPGPTFSGSAPVGGADADLIIGTTLIEVKTVKAANLKLRDAQQLIAYALLDFDDHYALTHAAILSARYGQLVTWELTEVLRQAGAMTLPEARALLERALS